MKSWIFVKHLHKKYKYLHFVKCLHLLNLKKMKKMRINDFNDIYNFFIHIKLKFINFKSMLKGIKVLEF